jgi:hypothetical protein
VLVPSIGVPLVWRIGCAASGHSLVEGLGLGVVVASGPTAGAQMGGALDATEGVVEAICRVGNMGIVVHSVQCVVELGRRARRKS